MYHLVMQSFVNGTGKNLDWSMHVLLQLLCSHFNLMFELTTLSNSMLTLAIWGCKLMILCHNFIVFLVQTRKLWAKVLMKLLISFGKNLNTLLKELVPTVFAQVDLNMMMPLKGTLILFGINCILFLLPRFLDLWPAKQPQSNWA